MPDVRSVGDRHAPTLAQAVADAITRVRGSVSLSEIETALTQPATLDDLPDWSAFWTLTKAAPADAETVIYEAIVSGARADGRFRGQLAVVNQAAVDMARRQAALLVVGLSRESRLAIRAAVTRALEGQMTVAQLARTVRDAVGLSPNFAGAVANYRLNLLAGNTDLSARFRLADSRFSSVGADAAKIDRMVSRYSERLLANRATVVARTESLKAAHSGRKELWRAARDEGLIPPDTKIVWQTAESDRTCEACSGLDGTVVGFDESFSATRGNVTFTEETPPIHPNCRCTTSLDL